MTSKAADLDFRTGVLSAARLFSDAPDEDVTELARVSRMVAAPRGKKLFTAGAAGEFVYVIQSGVVGELYAFDGQEAPLLIGLAGPRDVAGLSTAVSRRGGSIDCQALEAVTNVAALAIPAADLLRICRRSPELSIALAAGLALEKDNLAQIFALTARRSLESRLSDFFRRLVALIAGDDWSPVVNIGRLSQSGIASLLGVSREHVNRTLAMWERSGLIFQNKKGEILVRDVRRLETLATARSERAGGDKPDDWLWEIDAHLDRGLNQTALHLSLEALKRAPKETRYAHRAVLATARLGAISEALSLLEKLGLDKHAKDEDIASLKPRLLRDLAFQDADHPDRELILQSAREYDRVFSVTNGFYSGVNAAAGHAMAGDIKRAQDIAQAVRNIMANDLDDETEDNYWRRTTFAECKLLEGDAIAAGALFETAAGAEDATPGKRATTRKQLRRLAPGLGIDQFWIDRAAPQADVLFFSGPLAHTPDESALPLEDIRHALDKLLSTRQIGWAYGALASGADIVIAERLLEEGVSLSVYLPLAPAAFINASVASGGARWRERFIDCMRAADHIEWNHCAASPSQAAYALGASVAMGKAVRRADQLETTAFGFFAIQRDRAPATSLSIANLCRWKARGLPHAVIESDWPGRDKKTTAIEHPAALLFTLGVQGADAQSLRAWLGPADAPDDTLDVGDIALAFHQDIDGALNAARRFMARPEAATRACWLDAGAPQSGLLNDDPPASAAAFVTALCKPVTEPGRLYASDVFACAAAMAPDCAARFEYVGFASTREKLEPCALHLVRL